MFLKVNLASLESRKLSIDFESWLCSELDNQCRIVVLCSAFLWIASVMQTKNNSVVWIFLQDAYQDIVVILAALFMTYCTEIWSSESFLISVQFQYHILSDEKTSCWCVISQKHQLNHDILQVQMIVNQYRSRVSLKFSSC